MVQPHVRHSRFASAPMPVTRTNCAAPPTHLTAVECRAHHSFSSTAYGGQRRRTSGTSGVAKNTPNVKWQPIPSKSVRRRVRLLNCEAPRGAFFTTKISSHDNSTIGAYSIHPWSRWKSTEQHHDLQYIYIKIHPTPTLPSQDQAQEPPCYSSSTHKSQKKPQQIIFHTTLNHSHSSPLFR